MNRLTRSKTRKKGVAGALNFEIPLHKSQCSLKLGKYRHSLKLGKSWRSLKVGKLTFSHHLQKIPRFMARSWQKTNPAFMAGLWPEIEEWLWFCLCVGGLLPSDGGFWRCTSEPQIRREPKLARNDVGAESTEYLDWAMVKLHSSVQVERAAREQRESSERGKEWKLAEESHSWGSLGCKFSDVFSYLTFNRARLCCSYELIFLKLGWLLWHAQLNRMLVILLPYLPWARHIPILNLPLNSTTSMHGWPANPTFPSTPQLQAFGDWDCLQRIRISYIM